MAFSPLERRGKGGGREGEGRRKGGGREEEGGVVTLLYRYLKTHHLDFLYTFRLM